MKHTGTITFETDSQAAIYEHEMKGQISDGHWENTPGMDWKFWSGLTTLSLETGGSELGVDTCWMPSMKPGMGSKSLFECVGSRMLIYGRGAIIARTMGLHPIKDAALFEDCLSGLDTVGAPAHTGHQKLHWRGVPKWYRNAKSGYLAERIAKIKSMNPVEVLKAAENAVALYSEDDCRKDTRRISAISKRQHGDFSLSA